MGPSLEDMEHRKNQGEALKFTVDEALRWIDEYVAANDYVPTHMFMSRDMIHSMLLSTRDRFNFSEIRYKDGGIALQSRHGLIQVMMVGEGKEDFKIIGGPTAYAQHVIKTELLGGVDENTVNRRSPPKNI